MYTARAQFPKPNFPKNLPQFWDFHADIFSLCDHKLNLYFRSFLCGGRKFTTFLATFVFALRKKVIVFWKKIASPVSVPLGKCSTVRGSIPPRSVPTPCGYCPCLPSFCAVRSVLFLTRASARLPACCTRFLLQTLCLLP